MARTNNSDNFPTGQRKPIRFLISPGDTRWDSEFDAMFRVLEMLPVIDVALSFVAKGDKLLNLTLSDEERLNLKALVSVLQNFRTLSQHLQDRSTCISSASAAFDSLRSRLSLSDEQEKPFIQEFKQELLNQINSRFTDSYFAPCSIGSIAAIFRGKYKVLSHLSSTEKIQTLKWITRALHTIDAEHAAYQEIHQESRECSSQQSNEGILTPPTCSKHR